MPAMPFSASSMNHKQSSVEIIPTGSRAGVVVGHSTGVTEPGPGATGEQDLSKIIAALRVRRRPGTYVYVSRPAGEIAAAAMIEEDEGTTFVVEREAAERAGLAWSFAAAWLTVEVHTALDGIGLTAVVARTLADAAIPCNILAGYYHDHLLVPADRAEEAIAAIDARRIAVTRSGGAGASPG
jgi:hypothetical protein